VIVGKSGVFVIQPLSAPKTGLADASSVKRSSVTQLAGQVSTRLVNDAKSSAKVESQLSKVY